jgi:hypothetical protein
MAKSTLAIDTDLIHDFENDTANSAAELDATFAEIVSKVNGLLDTLTGHNHDGTDSRYIDASSVDDSQIIALRMGNYFSQSTAAVITTLEQAIIAFRMGAFV